MVTMKRMAGALFLMLMVLAGGSVAAPPAQSGGKMYKWVDDQGVIHYSDKAPLEAVNREQTILDRQARQIQKIEAAPTDNQRKISEEEAERQRLEQAQKDIAERKDRALLLSYLKEEDIDFARDRALAMLDAQIESNRAVLDQQQNRHKDLLERLETGKTLPEGELEKLETDIASRNTSIERDLREKEIIAAKYERDKRRWRELKEIEKARIEAEKQASKK